MIGPALGLALQPEGEPPPAPIREDGHRGRPAHVDEDAGPHGHIPEGVAVGNAARDQVSHDGCSPLLPCLAVVKTGAGVAPGSAPRRNTRRAWHATPPRVWRQARRLARPWP